MLNSNDWAIVWVSKESFNCGEWRLKVESVDSVKKKANEVFGQSFVTLNHSYELIDRVGSILQCQLPQLIGIVPIFPKAANEGIGGKRLNIPLLGKQICKGRLSVLPMSENTENDWLRKFHHRSGFAFVSD
jgi:hypothetical protein